jgi:hypothetical protein
LWYLSPTASSFLAPDLHLALAAIHLIRPGPPAASFLLPDLHFAVAALRLMDPRPAALRFLVLPRQLAVVGLDLEDSQWLGPQAHVSVLELVLLSPLLYLGAASAFFSNSPSHFGVKNLSSGSFP